MNPEKTYTEIDLSQGEQGASVWLFEVCFAEGETEKEIRITALEDELPETDEMATFTIVEHIGGEILQSLNTAALRIADNDADKDPPAQFGFTVTEATFDKSEGTARLTVQRTGGLVKGMSVDWTLEDGTAVAGADYAPVSGSLNFYGHESEQVIEIPLINDQAEDMTEKEFTVRLHDLKGNGTDGSCIIEEASRCTVRFYNSNTAENLNLASALQNNAVGVDVSANLTVEEGAQVSNQVLSGAQTGGNLPVEDNTTVEWGTDSNPKLRMYQYNNGGKIAFSGGDWTATARETLSISSNGEGQNTTTKNIANLGALYRSISASVSGGAGLCNWWDRMWHGNNEFAYTYFCWDPYENYDGYKDCSPKLTEDGGKVYLSWKSPFSVSDSLPYKTGDGSLTLGVAKNDSSPSEDNIDASAEVTLTRRTFSNDFKLNIYTANDPDAVVEVAKYDDSDYSNIIQSVSITNGRTDGGKLYEGSSVQIQLGNTHLTPAAAYLVDASGTTVMTDTLSGNAATFNNIVQDPNGSYTFYLVLDRNQDIRIDLSTSANILEDGSYADEAFSDAYTLLLENSETDTVTVGYTDRTGNDFDTKISEKTLSLSDRTLSGSILTLEKVANLQWINFNMPEADSFILNGKAYLGNEKIPLNIADIKTNNLQFYYYAAQYKTVQRPMNAVLDSTAIYYDGNANGVIDGYFDRATGNFVLDETSGDEFITYPEDGDYAEPTFAPVVDEDGKVHQYFFRPYYTANPVSLEAPEGKENEKMQVRPAFITDVTDPDSFTGLTEEQQQYRLIVSGQIDIKEADGITATGYSADNHAKYGAEASVYSYVDIPLGGDANPAEPVYSDLPDGRHTIDGKDCVAYAGQVYLYDANSPDGLGKGQYIWEPDYRGNLLYPFDDPEDIIIPHTMVQDEYPLTGTDLVNGYLGSFGDNDTFVLMICEQTKTTDEILGERNLRTSTGDSEVPLKETVTRGTVGSFSDPQYLMHMSSSTVPSTTADNTEYTDYDEITVNTKPELFAASRSILGVADVTTSGYTVAITVGVPISYNAFKHEHNRHEDVNGTQVGKLSEYWSKTGKWNIYDNIQEMAKVINLIKGFKDGGLKPRNYAAAHGEELAQNKLHFASVDVSILVSGVVILKYNALDNTYVFEQATLGVHCTLSLTLRYRFTPVPIIYVYSVISIGFGGQTGLKAFRRPEYKPAVISEPDTLYTSPQEDQAGSYTFFTDRKYFEIDFNGKLKVECFHFEDNNKNGIYDDGDTLCNAVDASVFQTGKITSSGEETVQVQIHSQKTGFSIDPVVVKLTPLKESASDATAATITKLVEIKTMSYDYAFSGIAIDVTGSIELGIGMGVDILKGELYGQASLGIAFTLFANAGVEEFEWAVFDEFTVNLALAFRLVILGFKYQMDELNNSLFSHFVRQVEAYVKVSPGMFNGPLSGNMDLQIELFSDDTSTSYDGSTGLYTSEHADEYDGINNVASASLEQTGFIVAPKKVTLKDCQLHYIPVHIRTTTEVPPLVRAEEIVEEGQEKKLKTLFFTANEHQNQSNVLSGYLTVIANGLSGDGVIHIVDESANSTHAITFNLASANEYGINFGREDSVIFRNVDGTVNTAQSTSKDWNFPVVPEGNWTALGWWVNNYPRNDDVAIGRKGATVSFFTIANQLEFHHSGSVSVSSGKFNASFVSGNSGTTDTTNGTATITGDSNGRVDNTVSFDSPAGELHKEGIGEGRYAPDLAVSREQMVTILYRYAGSPEVVESVLTFADADDVSQWAYLAVAWAAENGIVQGVGNKRFDAAGGTTRAAAAQVMMNYFKS